MAFPITRPSAITAAGMMTDACICGGYWRLSLSFLSAGTGCPATRPSAPLRVRQLTLVSAGGPGGHRLLFLLAGTGCLATLSSVPLRVRRPMLASAAATCGHRCLFWRPRCRLPPLLVRRPTLASAVPTAGTTTNACISCGHSAVGYYSRYDAASATCSSDGVEPRCHRSLPRVSGGRPRRLGDLAVWGVPCPAPSRPSA